MAASSPIIQRASAANAAADSAGFGLQANRLLDVEEVANLLGLSRNFVYNECGRGRLRHLRLGRRIKVPESALDGYLETAQARARLEHH